MIEKCLSCGTVNHLFIDHPDISAWECYFCQGRFWIDEAGKEQYMINNNCLGDQAESDLQNCVDNIIFVNGTYNG